MKYVRMNITLPKTVEKRLGKVTNKSAFIAQAVVERFKTLELLEEKKRLLEAYREVANHPEWEKDERDDW